MRISITRHDSHVVNWVRFKQAQTQCGGTLAHHIRAQRLCWREAGVDNIRKHRVEHKLRVSVHKHTVIGVVVRREHRK